MCRLDRVLLLEGWDSPADPTSPTKSCNNKETLMVDIFVVLVLALVLACA